MYRSVVFFSQSQLLTQACSQRHDHHVGIDGPGCMPLALIEREDLISRRVVPKELYAFMIVPGLLTASTSRADHFGMSAD